AAIPCVDTIKRVEGGMVVETLPRAALVAVQTPQAFAAPLLRRAHAVAPELDASDDCLLVEGLGAAGLGTMGDHFPSGEERWRGVSGREFLAQVAAKLAQADARVMSAEVALVCAQPRLAPFFAAMGEAMSAALATAPGTVTVTATSGDGLGPAGRGEGILASAVALLEVA